MTSQKTKLNKTVLDNGLTLVHVSLPNSNSSATGAFVKTGNRYDPDKLPGLAHFVEHMVFMGSNKYPDSLKFHEALEKYGAWNEAYTFPDYSHFLIKFGNEFAPEMVSALAEMIVRPMFKKAEIDNARNTIFEEYYSNFGNPQSEIGNLWQHLIWQGTKLERNYLGTEDSLKSITTEDLINFHKQEYTASNMVVFYAGAHEEQAIVELFSKEFVSLSKGNPKKIDFLRPGRNFSVKTSKNEGELVTFNFGFKTEGLNSKDTEALDLLKIIIGTGWSSRLGRELFLKNGLVYTWFMQFWQFIDQGYISFQSATQDKNINKVLEFISTEFENVRKNGVTKEELENAKRYFQGDLEIGIESPLDHLYWFGRQELFFPDNLETVADKIQKIKNVSLTEINSVAAKYFSKDNQYLAAIGPIEENELKKLI